MQNQLEQLKAIAKVVVEPVMFYRSSFSFACCTRYSIKLLEAFMAPIVSPTATLLMISACRLAGWSVSGSLFRNQNLLESP